MIKCVRMTCSFKAVDYQVMSDSHLLHQTYCVIILGFTVLQTLYTLVIAQIIYRIKDSYALVLFSFVLSPGK